MKLELKHLAPYLPYNLELKTLNGSSRYTLNLKELAIFDINDSIQLQHKPILRPLSDLTKEIEHNGEKFVPNKELDWALAIVENMVEQGNITGYGLSWDLWELLFEWHFDVFGLIPEGLAIEKP